MDADDDKLLEAAIEEANTASNMRRALTFVLADDCYIFNENLPFLEGNLAIVGDGHEISGHDTFRVFRVRIGGKLTLNEVRVTHGWAIIGGGIHNEGSLTLNGSAVTNNEGVFGGGGIWNSGTATLNNSEVSNNVASIAGGGIASSSIEGAPAPSLTLNDTVVENNRSTFAAGINIGKGSDDATVSLNQTTVQNNTAVQAGGGIIIGRGTAALNKGTIVTSNNAPKAAGIAVGTPLDENNSVPFPGYLSLNGGSSVTGNGSEDVRIAFGELFVSRRAELGSCVDDDDEIEVPLVNDCPL